MKTRRTILVTAVSAVVLAVTSLLGAGQASADYVGIPYCLENLDGRDECFWVGSTVTYSVPGYVYHSWESAPGGSWNGPQHMGAWATSGVDAARNDDGRLEVFIRGSDGALHHTWQLTVGGSWSGFRTLGGSIANDPGDAGPFVYVSGGRIHVNVRWSDGSTRMRYQTQRNCCWSGWVTI